MDSMVMSALIGLWLPRQMATTALTAPFSTETTVPANWLRAEIFMVCSLSMVVGGKSSVRRSWLTRGTIGHARLCGSLLGGI